MLKTIKKSAAFLTLSALLIVALALLPKPQPQQLKSFLLGDSEPVWGQAYSPNVGWINFYCDGSDKTRPTDATTGAISMPNFCSNTAYGTKFNATTEEFSGEAYSSNYGWLDMSGLSLNASNKFEGSTNGSGITGGSVYNFGTTYFKKNQPNNDNPGVYYNDTNGNFCGFAYSDQVGYISFCDPQTKELSPDDVSVSGYDYDTYAVYMGIITDNIPPALTSPQEIFAATDAQTILLTFADEDSDIVSATATIDDSAGNPQTYTYSGGAGNPIDFNISSHDFSKSGNYDLDYTVCDEIGNCDSTTSSGYFQVVANIPVFPTIEPIRSFLAFSVNPAIVSDGVKKHQVQLTLVDTYGNPVISVAGVKSVDVDFKFDNTTELDQIQTNRPTGDDSALFTASEFNFSQDGGTSTGSLVEAAGGDGVFQVDVKSYTPTSEGYTPIVSDGFDLWFKEITYTVTKLGNTGVGESTGTRGSVDSNRKFGFSPALTSTPEALVWNGSDYISDPAGIGNITVNAAKRFNVDLENKSGDVAIDSPELGLAIDNGANSNITWESGLLEEVDTFSNLSETLNLDTDTNTVFDETTKNLSSWISSIATTNTKILRFRATPALASGSSAAGSMDTTLQTYTCYTIGSKDVCHRNEKLDSGGVDAQLVNPGIEIIGSVSSSVGGTSSKKTGAALSQSIGDIAQNEFKTEIDRNTAVLTQDASVNACSGGMITDLANYWGNNPNCTHLENSVLYLTGDVTLNLSGNLPSGTKTVLVENGDLHIKSDLIPSAGSSNSFGIIVLNGDVYVYPSVIDVNAVLYSEGSLISVNANGKFGEDTTTDCTGTGFCDRSYELRNQLYWKGIIATQNTIGGSDRSTQVCPTGITSCSRPEARVYDLAYLRTYHTNSGTAGSSNTTSTASLVVEYDSRIQSNPPPLFESSQNAGGIQLGN